MPAHSCEDAYNTWNASKVYLKLMLTINHLLTVRRNSFFIVQISHLDTKASALPACGVQGMLLDS